MKAVMISGSPRKEGNTELLLKRCMSGFEKEKIESKFISLSGKQIKTCTGCAACRKLKDKTCVIKDDDFHPILNEMIAADIIVVGSPVYFGSATPEMMALLDRAGYVSRGNGNLFSRKIGGPIVVARRAGQNFTYAQLMYWYIINDMIVAGSNYWNVSFGGDRGDVINDKEGLATVDRFAENLAWLGGKVFT